MRAHQKSKEAEQGMKTKQIFRYSLVALVTVFVVAGSILIPPALAQNNDASFLEVIQTDSGAAETYRYKPTKYQKVRVLYEQQMQSGYFPIFSAPYNTPEKQNTSQEEYYKSQFATLGQTIYSEDMKLPNGVRMGAQEAKTAAQAAFDDLGQTGGLPCYKNGMGKIFLNAYPNGGVELHALNDPLVSGVTFYFWYIYGYDNNTNTNYQIVMDDEEGVLYVLGISYGYDDAVVLEKWDNKKSAQEKADVFLNKHGMKTKEKVWGDSVYGYETLVYSADEPDYEAIISMKTNQVTYIIMLKPSDL